MTTVSLSHNLKTNEDIGVGQRICLKNAFLGIEEGSSFLEHTFFCNSMCISDGIDMHFLRTSHHCGYKLNQLN